ncbi:hypothetical protein BHE74_00026981 [Ensete ventricosum]|nr:hypothetical protein BHE74_00026981 [Ensete ventricosum]
MLCGCYLNYGSCSFGIRETLLFAVNGRNQIFDFLGRVVPPSRVARRRIRIPLRGTNPSGKRITRARSKAAIHVRPGEHSQDEGLQEKEEAKVRRPRRSGREVPGTLKTPKPSTQEPPLAPPRTPATSPHHERQQRPRRERRGTRAATGPQTDR